MKKTVRMFLDFFSGNILKSLALIIILSSALVIISNQIANYRYMIESIAYIESDYFKDSILVQTGAFELNYSDFMYASEDEDFLKLCDKVQNEKILEKSKNFSAVKSVYGYNTYFGRYDIYPDDVNVKVSNAETCRAFCYPLSSGTWFDGAEQNGEYPNAVICGSMFDNVSVGENIDIFIPAHDKNLKIHVIGKVAAPYYNFRFSGGGNSYEAFDIENNLITSNSVFLLDNDITNRQLKDLGLVDNGQIGGLGENFIVKFKEDATKEEIKEYTDYITDLMGDENEVRENIKRLGNGEFSDEDIIYTPPYFEVNDIVRNGNENLNQKVSNNLIPQSLFYIVVSTVVFLIVSVFMVKKKLDEHFIYHICGCSRKKSFGMMLSAIILIGVISAAVTSVYIAIQQYLISANIIKYSYIYFDIYSYLFVIVYVIVVSLICVIIPYIVFAKNTPVELYRKRTKGI